MALPVAVAVSVLAGTGLVLAPATSAASSAYAVTEVPLPLGYATNSVAADPVTNTAYATTTAPGIAVISGKNNAIAAEISLPNYVLAVAVDQASHTVYAIGYSNHAIAYVIDGASNTVETTISLPSGLLPYGAAVNPVTHRVYVTDRTNGDVVVIDGSTDTVAATIPLADPTLAPKPFPVGVAVDAVTNTIDVSDVTDNQIDVINGATNTVTSRIDLPAGSFPAGVAADQAGLVYVADHGTGSISVIDTATASVSTLTSGMTQPYALALDSGSGTLYATTQGGSPTAAGVLSTTYVIDPSSGMIETQVPRGGSSVATDGGSAYVAGSSTTGGLDRDVTVISPSAVNAMSPVIVGFTPNTTLTVGQPAQGQLVVSATPAATISATGLPVWLTFGPSGVLSGTPPAGTAGATYNISVTAANGVAPSASGTFTLIVQQPPAITSADHAIFLGGVASGFTVTATGYPPPTFSETGALPAGVTLHADGVLSGTPAAGTAGVYPIQVTATNNLGTATQTFRLTVTGPPALAVGAEGANGAMYVQAPAPLLTPGWHSEGGQIVGPPAVAAPPNPDGLSPAPPLFIATGTNKRLYIRSLTTGWQQITPAASCLGSPAAVITAGTSGLTLTVACEGTNRALYYDTATLKGSAPPTTFNGGWKSLGGVLSAGPAVAPVGGAMTFFARGTNGRIYTRTLTAGYTLRPWACIGAPAAALQAATGITTFACQGTNHQLYEAAASRSGWTGAVSLGGSLIGGPAVAATTQKPVFLAEGTNHAVWELSGGWTSLGGSVIGGVGAAALN